MPVYNKAQYPRISLSCIFNDFLGDFGRSTERKEGGRKKKKKKREEKEKENFGRRNASEIGIVKTELYIPPSSPRATLLDRALY